MTVSICTFSEYVVKAAERIQLLGREGQRTGQIYFNLLSDLRPDLAEYVQGQPFDPFHDDTKIPEFLGIVAIQW